jgi:hypothetical protein
MKCTILNLFLLILPVVSIINDTFYNPILFAVCTSKFSKLCKNLYSRSTVKLINWHVEECSAALLYMFQVLGLLWLLLNTVARESCTVCAWITVHVFGTFLYYDPGSLFVSCDVTSVPGYLFLSAVI